MGFEFSKVVAKGGGFMIFSNGYKVKFFAKYPIYKRHKVFVKYQF
jgi:hypothetical protein